MNNRLFYGDCLDVLKNSIEDESIDLIYIDPPFNSKRNYNVLFESIDMSDTKAQKEAFADTWSNVRYVDELQQIQEFNLELYRFLQTLEAVKISQGAVSYLTMMALRISHMHRKLKPTGSFYLHCDPTMSHYLKIVCDLIFNEKNFRNEIIWHYRRWTAASRRFQRMHDVIFFYAKSSNCAINLTHVMPTEGQMKKHERGWDRNTVPIKGTRRPQLIVYDQVKVDIAVKKGKLNLSDFARIVKPSSSMTTAPDVWEINYINSQAKERLGYPTQKPEILLERIIEASSNEGDVIADFFCGCGTAVAVAQRLNRNWVGSDISHLAVRLIHDRILKPYLENGGRFQEVQDSIEIDGFPRDLATAKELAVSTKKGRIKFQDWIVEIMLGGVSNPKKVGDGGYDGYLTMYRDSKNRDVVLVEVKSGIVGVKNIREFIHVVENENREMGIFVCFSDEVTKPMLRESLGAGYYEQELYGSKFPRIQIITVEELLEGKSLSHPHPAIFNVTFKQAFRRK